MSSPFIQETVATSATTAEDLAAAAGVPVAAIEAFREGRPHWTLTENVRRVADVFGVDAGELRAQISRSTRQIIKGQVFDGAGREGFRGLIR